MNNALGMVETRGLATAVTVADIMVKTADVTLLGVERAKGQGWVTVKVSGNVAAVKAAVEAGIAISETCGDYVASKVIPKPVDAVRDLFMQEEQTGDWFGDYENGTLNNFKSKETKKVEPEKPEAETEEPVKKIEAAKVEQPKTEPVKKVEAAKVEQPKTEPVKKVEAAKVEQPKAEPVKKVEAAKVEQPKAETVKKAEPVKNQQAKKVETVKVEKPKTDPKSKANDNKKTTTGAAENAATVLKDK